MKYDDAEYYFLNFEDDSPIELGGCHMGFYLAWLLLKGHGSEEHADDVSRLQAREATGVEVLFEGFDGALLDEDFDDTGNAFTAAYYEQHYFGDFERVFHDDFPDTGRPNVDACSIPPTWEHQARISAVLDARWAQWEAGQGFAPLPEPEPAPATAATAAPPPLPSEPVDAPTQGDVPSFDAMLDIAQDALRRFLGFEAFIPDAVNAEDGTDTRRARRFLSEFPGGCHWLELVAIREPVDGGVRAGLGVAFRSRIQSLARALAALEIPGYGRSEPDDGELFDSVYLWLPRWWGDGPVPATHVRGREPAVYLRHASELPAVAAHLGQCTEQRLRPWLRKFETPAGLEAMLNSPSILEAPAFLPTRMIQNVYLAATLGNPRLGVLCDEALRLAQQLPPSPEVEALRAYIASVRAAKPA